MQANNNLALKAYEIRNHPYQNIEKGINAVELQNKQFPPVNWFVKSLIPQGLTVIAGQSKIGKSWFLMQLGICVSTGRNFLGGWQCEQNGICYVSLEDGVELAQHRQKKLGLHVNEKLHYLDKWEHGFEGVDKYFEKYPNIKVMMIDTWGKFNIGYIKNNNDYQEVSQYAEKLQKIAHRHNAGIILCHHTKKGASHDLNKGTGNNDSVDSVSGSNALIATADTILILARPRGSTDGKLYVTGRRMWDKTIELTCADNWLWTDKNAHNTIQPLSEFDQFSGTCQACYGQGVITRIAEDGKEAISVCPNGCF